MKPVSCLHWQLPHTKNALVLRRDGSIVLATREFRGDRKTYVSRTSELNSAQSHTSSAGRKCNARVSQVVCHAYILQHQHTAHQSTEHKSSFVELLSRFRYFSFFPLFVMDASAGLDLFDTLDAEGVPVPALESDTGDPDISSSD